MDQYFGTDHREFGAYWLDTRVVTGGGLLSCGEGTGTESDDCGGTPDDRGRTSDDCGGTSVEVDASGEVAIVGVGGMSVVVDAGFGPLLDAGTPLGGESFIGVDEGLLVPETDVSVQGRLSQGFFTP